MEKGCRCGEWCGGRRKRSECEKRRKRTLSTGYRLRRVFRSELSQGLRIYTYPTCVSTNGLTSPEVEYEASLDTLCFYIACISASWYESGATPSCPEERTVALGPMSFGGVAGRRLLSGDCLCKSYNGLLYCICTVTSEGLLIFLRMLMPLLTTNSISSMTQYADLNPSRQAPTLRKPGSRDQTSTGEYHGTREAR